jgi:hypothetical protein
MYLTTFESTTKAYTGYDNPSYELPWEELVSVLSEHDDANEKTKVMMYNLARFKDQNDPTHELGRRYIWVDGERTDEFEELPETIRRCKNNVLSISGVVLDVDNNMDIGEVIVLLDGLEYFLYTTFNHTISKHKFRVILPFKQELLAGDIPLYEESIKTAFPGVDNASFTCSQSFYFHSGKEDCIVYRGEGEMLDPYVNFEKVEPQPIAVTPRQLIHEVMSQDFKDSYQAAVVKSLFSCSGLRFAGKNDKLGVLTLINICRSVELGLEAFTSICSVISDTDSTLQNPAICKKVWNEWQGDKITKAKRDKFMTVYHGKPVEVKKRIMTITYNVISDSDRQKYLKKE